MDLTVTARALWLETHPLLTISDKAHVEDATFVVVSDSHGRNVRRNRPLRKRGPNFETKPIEKVATPQ
jgi:hypothetical protein